MQNVTSPPPPPLLSVVIINPYAIISLNTLQNPNLLRCHSSRRRGSGTGTQSSRFNFEDDTKRIWWSELDSEDDDDYDETGFRVLEQSFDTSFIFKVLNAFGWMIPAIAISMLLGTGGTNTFLMALVLPLVQSVVSFIADTFLGNSIGGPKPKRKRAKKKPFHRARSSTDMKQDANTRGINENYQSQQATKNKPHSSRASTFGGWDELDKGLGSYEVPEREPTRKTNAPWLEKECKLSRRVRTRERPLLVRLLIAVFPFLGSWTRLL